MISKKAMEKSLDYRWLEKQRNIYFGLTFLILMVVLLLYMIELQRELFVGLIVAGFTFIMAIVYHIQAILLIRNFERYEIQEVVLNEAHIAFFSRAMYYNVQVKISEVETKKIKTRAMWNSLLIGGLGYFHTQAYSGKVVEIAYDRLKDKVYVLGLKKELENKEDTL